MKVVESRVTSEGHQEEIFIFVILIMLFFRNSYCNVLLVKTLNRCGNADFYQMQIYCGGGRGMYILSGT